MLGGWTAFGLGAGIAGGAGLIIGTVSSHIDDTNRVDKAERKLTGDPTAQRPNDGFSENADGYLRLGMWATAGLTAAATLGAGILHRPNLARAFAGASVGLVGAALVGGRRDRPLGDQVLDNVSSTGRALSSEIHSSLSAQHLDLEDFLPIPADDDAAPPREAKPTAQEIRSAALEMPGTPDLAAARVAADRALAQLDFTRHDLVLWVPGTNDHSLPDDWRDPVDAQFGDEASQALVDYPSNIDFGGSVSTGMETLRLVLAGIAQRGGDHRVLLAGHSQGSWVIGDALAAPELHAMVDRAIVFARPGAATVDYSSRTDQKVMEVDNPNDPITWPIDDRATFFEAMDDLAAGERVSAGYGLLQVAQANPGVTLYLASKFLDRDRWNSESDPHHYESLFTDGAAWLDTGEL